MKTCLKISDLFFIVIAVFVAGGVMGVFLPDSPGRNLFTPGMEITTAIFLFFLTLFFFLGILLSLSRLFSMQDLVFALCLVQIFIAAIVSYPAGFSWSIYFCWLSKVSQSITLPLAEGIAVGYLIKITRNREQKPMSDN